MSVAVTPEMIDAMIDAGLTREQMAAVIKAALAQDAARLAERRARDAERQRRSRANRAMSRDVTVTERDCCDRPPLEERSPTPPKTQSPQSSPPSGVRTTNARARTGVDGRSDEEWFDDFWAAYPKRAGSNPRKLASQRFIAAINAGYHPQAIIDGARQYADVCRQTGKWQTEYVAQAATWLSQQRWQDEHLPALRSQGPPQRRDSGSFIETAFRLTGGFPDDHAPAQDIFATGADIAGPRYPHPSADKRAGTDGGAPTLDLVPLGANRYGT